MRPAYCNVPIIWLMCCALGAVVGGCGIFTPREVEPPRTSTSEDPLGFAQILSNSTTTDRFEELDYQDLFHQDMVYIHEVEQFDRDRLRNRLNSIANTYPVIQTHWEVADTNERDPLVLDQGSVVTLNTRRYRVFRGDKTIEGTDTTYELDFAGEAVFKLKYSPDKETWTIYEWRDSPLGTLEKPFFHPHFGG